MVPRASAPVRAISAGAARSWLPRLLPEFLVYGVYETLGVLTLGSVCWLVTGWSKVAVRRLLPTERVAFDVTELGRRPPGRALQA